MIFLFLCLLLPSKRWKEVNEKNQTRHNHYRRNVCDTFQTVHHWTHMCVSTTLSKNAWKYFVKFKMKRFSTKSDRKTVYNVNASESSSCCKKYIMHKLFNLVLSEKTCWLSEMPIFFCCYCKILPFQSEHTHSHHTDNRKREKKLGIIDTNAKNEKRLSRCIHTHIWYERRDSSQTNSTDSHTCEIRE